MSGVGKSTPAWLLALRLGGPCGHTLTDRLFDVPGRLDCLRDNYRAVADEDPSAVVLTTDGRSPEELADLIVKHPKGDREVLALTRPRGPFAPAKPASS